MNHKDKFLANYFQNCSLLFTGGTVGSTDTIRRVEERKENQEKEPFVHLDLVLGLASSKRLLTED